MNALGKILFDALKSSQAIESADGNAVAGSNLLRLAEQARHTLADRGVAPNEPVHVAIGNRPTDLGALLGVWQAGAVAVPLHVSAAASTVARVARISRARFAIDGERLDTIGPAPPPDRALLRDAALVIFTSGSTGEPKGVVIGHRRLADKLAVLDRLLNIATNDVVLWPLQLAFIFGLWVSLLTLRKGARLMLVSKFTGDGDGARSRGSHRSWPASLRCSALCWLSPTSPRRNCGRCGAAARCWRRHSLVPWGASRRPRSMISMA